ncbi:MFS transporter [Rhizorhabdus wittichii]|jgi:MFS family permease|uniref:Major facilitator superfamily MFS_1 n=2 Tax=Rhizorhabdus wittichii TaxID=160791 RepID=A0A9J9LBP9_RHIWR|nr:MFS transporter [Rhizorhabdus wittichii]ABQ67577.1 major facilitator superfamily MFS_1 [Rhizorhabdus wittichii RW1]ARR55656.1 MFS transporter [Rhizorhabdus wittichii DC-6]QTH22031.1 MFS transporter [Rhizorhabdus wittichii]
MAKSAHPLSIPAYRSYWLARFASTLALNGMVVIIGWQVYDVARRTMPPREAALQLGLIGLVQFLPLMLLTLVTGLVADRIDRRWIARSTAALEMLCAAALALLTWLDLINLPALFVIAALLGVARAFAGPALQALAPNLVPKAVLPAAIAVSSFAWQVGAIAGPPLGGYLYAIHAPLAYAVSAGLLALATVMLLRIGPVPRAVVTGSQHPLGQMLEGISYLKRNRLVLGAISLDLFAVLLGGATAMLPIYARDILHVGTSGLGHLRAAPAIGAAAVAIWLSRWPLHFNVGLKLLVAVGVFGAATILFGISYRFPDPMALSLVCLALLGGADMVSVYVRQTLIQLYTPDEMRGRVGAVSTLFISGSNELGEAESGFLAALVGPVTAVVAGGIGTIMVAVLWARLFPEILRARTFDPPTSFETVPGQEKAA